MKILILSDYIENFDEVASYEIRYQTASKLADLGNDVVFISPKNSSGKSGKISKSSKLKYTTSPGLFPNRYRTGGFSFIDLIKKTSVVLNGKFDVIQVTNGHRPAHFIPCIIGKYLKRAKIIDECWEWLGVGGYAEKRSGIIGKIIGLYDKYFELRLKMFFDTIITISSTLRKRFDDGNNVVVINGGAPNNALKDHNIRCARNELKLKNDRFIIGMSNICYADNEDNEILFESFKRISEENKDCFLLFTGKDKLYVENIGNKFSISKRIIFPGWINFNQYNKYLSCCDIFALPLKNTNINCGRWPNKVGDYLCLNRPIISNPTGDIKKLFEKYKIGLLCEANPDSFYLCIKNIIENKVNIQEYNQDSMYVAKEVLSFDKRVEKMIDIFESV